MRKNGFDVVEIFVPTLLMRPKHEYLELKKKSLMSTV